MAEGQSIYFDSTYTLRVVEEDKFKDTERLHEECTGFTESELQAPAPRVAIDGGRRRGSRRSPWSCLHPALVGRRPQLSPQGRAHAAGWRRLESRACAGGAGAGRAGVRAAGTGAASRAARCHVSRRVARCCGHRKLSSSAPVTLAAPATPAVWRSVDLAVGLVAQR